MCRRCKSRAAHCGHRKHDDSAALVICPCDVGKRHRPSSLRRPKNEVLPLGANIAPRRNIFPSDALSRVNQQFMDLRSPCIFYSQVTPRAKSRTLKCVILESDDYTGPLSSTASCRAGTPPTRRPSSAISASARAGASVGKALYLLHVLRKHMEYPELKRAVLEQAPSMRLSC